MNSELHIPSNLPIVNIAAYRFAPLQELQALRLELLAFCRSNQLRGTILLSTEGINLFMAGGAELLLSKKKPPERRLYSR
jgi:predicted sulfurtransferase